MDSVLLSHSPVAIIKMSTNGDILSIHQELDEELISSLSLPVICDSNFIYDSLVKSGKTVKLDMSNEILSDWRNQRFANLLEKTGLVTSYDEYKKIIRIAAVKDTRERVKQNAAKADEIVAQIIHSIDDLQKSVNLASNRLTELYGLHFPEMVDIISNIITLARIIAREPQRAKLDKDILSSFGIPGSKIDMVLSYIDSSLGGDLTENSLVPVVEYANSLIYMYEKMRLMEKWIDDSMSRIAPNLTAVAGPNVGARLISAMGSLRALAMKSSSKIQIIGAEKALYSSLRTKGNPPKHGIIFQIPEIGNSPYWVRGRIARAFAAKIVIAARLDFFDGEFLGAKMREELREMEKEIRKRFPHPPPQKPKTASKYKNKGGKKPRRRKK